MLWCWIQHGEARSSFQQKGAIFMCLVTFEGIDGSGKSTQAALLREHLQDEGYDVLLVRDPGGTALSERVRRMLLDAAHDVNPMAELMLFCAARAQLVAERIRPALADGKIVLCDRFYDSTTAYQGGGRAVAPRTWLEDLHHHVTGGLVPARTYWVHVAPSVAQKRRGNEEDRTEDRMEAERNGFQARVAQAYAQLAERHPHRICTLDGTASVASIQAHIRDDMHRLLESECGTAGSSAGSSDR